MAERVLDVLLELDPDALGREHDPTRAVADAARRAADDECERQSATLRHPEPREVIVREATDAISGCPVLLVATRWIADGPA